MFGLKVNIFSIFKGDKVLWLIVLFLFIFSSFAIFSSTNALAYRNEGGDYFYFLKRHVSFMILGIAAAIVFSRIHYKHLFKYAKIGVVITTVLLIYTLFRGASINSASRWIEIAGLTVQTSDYAKIALIIYVSHFLAKKRDTIADPREALKPILIATTIICGLIFPANFSTSAILFFVILILMFIGGIKLKHFALLIGSIVVIGGLGLIVIFNFPDILPRSETWKNRIESFVSADKGEENFQAEQSKIAVATGGIIGKGPGNSIQRNILPHPYSDFIYAILVEEWGLVGGILILLLYLIILYRGVTIAHNSSYLFPAYLSYGLSFMLVLQALINMAVAVNLLPVTGQTLPLMSMGGSSLIAVGISLGIILNISLNLPIEENEKNESDN